MGDVHNPAVPDTTRGTLLTENVLGLRRRPNKRQWREATMDHHGQLHMAGPTEFFESSLWRCKGQVVVEYVER